MSDTPRATGLRARNTSVDLLDAEAKKLRAEVASLIAERDALRAALINTAAHLAASISLLERGGKKAAASNKMFAQMLEDYRKSLGRARAELAKYNFSTPDETAV